MSIFRGKTVLLLINYVAQDTLDKRINEKKNLFNFSFTVLKFKYKDRIHYFLFKYQLHILFI